VPVKPYVRLSHLRFTGADTYFRELEARLKAGDADFIDGTVFSPGEMYLTLGRFAASAPYTSDYTYEHIYYRAIARSATTISRSTITSGVGHRLVLGARRRACAEPARPAALRPQPPRLAHIHEDHALE